MRTLLTASRLAALLVLACTTTFAIGDRQVVPFNSDWKFSKGDHEGAAAATADDASWERVTLPHTWNTNDALPGDSMYKGPGWYRKRFMGASDWKGRRVFVRFEAASLVAEVYLNGTKLGEHRGGFAAFCFELTQGLRLGQENVIAVKVNNERGTVSPLGGDFTIYGGLYRPASLIVTNQVAITALDYASPGVYLKQTSVTQDRAEVEATVKVDNASNKDAKVDVVVTILDAQHKRVLSARTSAPVASGAVTALNRSITLPKPHLWNGVADPYLYTALVEVFQGRKKSDSIEQPLGLRSFHVDPEHGSVLNGKAFQIHGVCRHQEGPEGWAVSEKQQDADMQMMREMGVNGVRLVHYQHSEYFHRLCDRNGLVTWSELALVNRLHDTPEFRQNLRQQLTELIRQNYNHPSIVMWSMYNEIESRNQAFATGVVEELNDLAHSEDPTRSTTGAASNDTIQNLQDLVRSLDLISDNAYQGWYLATPADMGPAIDKWNKLYGSKGISVSEYGAGGSIHQHQQGMTARPDPRGRFHPEEWESICHEGNYEQFRQRPFIWGTFLWVMFDFASAGRHEGDMDGINDKGLVTRDRATRKDAYFYYQANWADKPMAYITSRRDLERTSATTAIKVYSNCPRVAIKLNGASLGEAVTTQNGVFVRDGVTLAPGENVIEVEATKDGETVRDTCKWLYVPGKDNPAK